MTRLTDAAPARDRLRELAVEGYPLTFLADLTLVSPDTLGAVRSGRRTRIQQAVHQAITYACALLHGTDPAQHGVPDGPAASTRLLAARAGWTTSSEGGAA